MDLLSTIRKTGSRGGVNFSWDEVASSSRRENYLGHSLKAPVGRWQQGKDLNWYAKAGTTPANADETEEEREARERKEELRKVKEAEEDAIARALGLPVKQRDTTGANSIEVGTKRQIGPASGPPDDAAETAKAGAGQAADDERRGREKSRRHRETEMAVADTEAEAEAATERRERDGAAGAAVATGSTGIADNGAMRERAGMGGKRGGTGDTEVAVAAGTVEDADIGMTDPDTAAAPDLRIADVKGEIEAHAADLASDCIRPLLDCIS
ncbi:hypothetical protein LLEC1_02856 [Akanthomyces lecanii]|uniref:Multiple myeloma tumor-associated protein 2-like N-terminal domain-containing protein n=1 Tax=Cordyceps confragosa TaxID=2714763 RepID=A0A179HZV7_CORDF|nr:hypothetical protein LLEC1_02856 [Akanthomyces lecanii]